MLESPTRVVADPAPLGLAAFGATAFMLSLFNPGVRPTLIAAVFPTAFLFGGVVQLVAGIFELKQGGTFGGTAFSAFGAFWMSYAAYGHFIAPTLPPEQVHFATGMFALPWAILAFCLTIATLRTNCVPCHEHPHHRLDENCSRAADPPAVAIVPLDLAHAPSLGWFVTRSSTSLDEERRPAGGRSLADMGRRQFDEVDDLGQILYCDDPALRLDDLLMVLDTAEGALVLDPAQTPHMPAALFDFRVAIGAGGSFPYAATRTAPVDDELKDPRIGGAVQRGMMLLPPEFGELRLPPSWFGDDRVVIAMKRMMSGDADLRSIPGWELHATADDPPEAWARMNCAYSRLELRTPGGALYSRTWVPYDPEWRAAALLHEYVVCLCGVELGIRAPYAMTDAQYTPGMRHANFRRACVAGLALGGLVPYTDHH